jgi:transcription antitermination factor NusG
MPGIRRIVCSGDQPTIVADEIVNLIRRRLSGIKDIGYADLAPGDRVRIQSGPLRDLDAVFEQQLSAVDRVRVLMNVMGRMTPVDIDRSEIVRI